MIFELKLPELKGGGKQVRWTEVGANNRWYLHKKFLLPSQVLANPIRIPEHTLRAYWSLWYRLQQEGQPFTFRKVGTSIAGGNDNSGALGETGEGDQDKEKETSKGKEKETSKDNEDDEEVKTPKSCESDEEKISFLQSLLPSTENHYHSLVKAVASMKVSMLTLRVAYALTLEVNLG